MVQGSSIVLAENDAQVVLHSLEGQGLSSNPAPEYEGATDEDDLDLELIEIVRRIVFPVHLDDASKDRYVAARLLQNI